MTFTWRAAGGTDVGRVRDANEDAFRADGANGVFLVADGMGGHAAGEVASTLAAEVVSEALASAVQLGAGDDALSDVLRSAVLSAHASIVRRCLEAPTIRGMGTTLTAVVVDPEGTLHAAHVGDSRLYLFRRRSLLRLTRDHTWVQQEVDAGKIAEADARNHPHSHILTNVLTDDAEPMVDLLAEPLAHGDVLLLATDGLYNMLEDERIAELATAVLPLEARVASLIREANRAGGADNITAVVVEIEG